MPAGRGAWSRVGADVDEPALGPVLAVVRRPFPGWRSGERAWRDGGEGGCAEEGKKLTTIEARAGRCLIAAAVVRRSHQALLSNGGTSRLRCSHGRSCRPPRDSESCVSAWAQAEPGVSIVQASRKKLKAPEKACRLGYLSPSSFLK